MMELIVLANNEVFFVQEVAFPATGVLEARKVTLGSKSSSGSVRYEKLAYAQTFAEVKFSSGSWVLITP
jgi:hypothetical protein